MWETLYFAAMLRLPREMTTEQKKQRVAKVIAALGLNRCKDTIIGRSSTKLNWSFAIVSAVSDVLVSYLCSCVIYTDILALVCEHQHFCQQAPLAVLWWFVGQAEAACMTISPTVLLCFACHMWAPPGQAFLTNSCHIGDLCKAASCP